MLFNDSSGLCLLLCLIVILSHEEGKRKHRMVYYRFIATVIKPVLSNLENKFLHFLVLLHFCHSMF